MKNRIEEVKFLLQRVPDSGSQLVHLRVAGRPTTMGFDGFDAKVVNVRAFLMLKLKGLMWIMRSHVGTISCAA